MFTEWAWWSHSGVGFTTLECAPTMELRITLSRVMTFFSNYHIGSDDWVLDHTFLWIVLGRQDDGIAGVFGTDLKLRVLIECGSFPGNRLFFPTYDTTGWIRRIDVEGALPVSIQSGPRFCCRFESSAKSEGLHGCFLHWRRRRGNLNWNSVRKAPVVPTLFLQSRCRRHASLIPFQEIFNHLSCFFLLYGK